MSGPVWKISLLVFTSPQNIDGQPIAAGLDPDGVPCVWYVAGSGPSVIDVTPTGAPAPMDAEHLSTLVWGDLVLHVWVRR